MQLIIDIPDKHYEMLKNTDDKNIGNLILEAVKHGVILPKSYNKKYGILGQIRHEITKLFEGCYLSDAIDEHTQGEHCAYKKVIDIIDRYLECLNEYV